LRGARTLSAILPTGRVAWLRVDPALTPSVTIDQLAQGAEHTARWGRAVAQGQSESIARLAHMVAGDAERLSDGGLERMRALRRRMVAGDGKLARELAKAAEQYQSRIDKQLRIERETVRRLGRRDLWDQILIASALPLFPAYGEPGRPLGVSNITLTLSLLIWLVGDEIVDALFGSEEASPYPLRDTDVWSYLAPIGNLLAGWWLLSDLQHQRFVAGRSAIAPESFKPYPSQALAAPRAWWRWGAPVGGGETVYRCEKRISLSPFMGSAYFPDFQTFTDVPAVSTISSISGSAVSAEARIRLVGTKVRNGELTITLEAVTPSPELPVVEVAWIVDTQQPPTPAPAS
jgi:hypothetical protein